MRPETPVLLFPGQSSRHPAMIETLTAVDPAAAATLARASVVLGRDLGAHYRSGNPAVFATNRDVQVGVFLANHLRLEALGRAGVVARWSLGLSLGEYNHLVHIGALGFEEALALVDRRGALYDQGPEGVMVSVFPVAPEAAEEAIRHAEMVGRAVVGLYNSPRQQVLSGERDAVARVLAGLEDGGFVDAVTIEPRLPMHSPVFEPVARRLREVLRHAAWRRPEGRYLPNVLGTFAAHDAPGEVVSRLTEHVHRPVRWRASIDAVAAHVERPLFVEVGPRAVLTHLFRGEWAPGRRLATDVPEGGVGNLSRLAEELGRAVA